MYLALVRFLVGEHEVQIKVCDPLNALLHSHANKKKKRHAIAQLTLPETAGIFFGTSINILVGKMETSPHFPGMKEA